MQIADPKVYVGIDVSKDWLDVAVRPMGDAWQVNQDEGGIQSLVERLTKLRPELIVMEASGGYERLVATELGTAQLPWATPGMFVTLLAHREILAKTDRLDAASDRTFRRSQRSCGKAPGAGRGSRTGGARSSSSATCPDENC